MARWQSLVIACTLAPIAFSPTYAASTFSWEDGTLQGWTDQDGLTPGGNIATAKTAAQGVPAGAITDGIYALELTHANNGQWSQVVRAPGWTPTFGNVIHDELIAGDTLEFDLFVPSSSVPADLDNNYFALELNIEGQGMNFNNALVNVTTDQSLHVKWKYGSNPAFNPSSPWSQFTLITQADANSGGNPGVATMSPIYLDNFQISSAPEPPLGDPNRPASATVGNYVVQFEEEFDGDLPIWRETHNVYSGPDTVPSGDHNLVRQQSGQPGWRTRYRFGPNNPHDGRAHFPVNFEAQFHLDPWYEGTSGSPLGVNPFRLENGNLTISATPIDPTVEAGLPEQIFTTTDVHDRVTHTSGNLISQHLFDTKYGYFEMRAQLPAGQGLWPAFWLLPTTDGTVTEIDIFEVLGHEPEKLYASLVVEPSSGVGDFHLPVDLGVDTSDGMHIYGLDWNAEEIIWYFDGQVIARTPTPADFHQEMYMLINLSVGGEGSWPGPADGTTPNPSEMILDYIRVFRLAGDTDADGDVDGDDLSQWSSNFGMASGALYSDGDADEDGDVDGHDFLLLQKNFGIGVSASASTSTTVPEPSVFVLVVTGLGGLVLKHGTTAH